MGQSSVCVTVIMAYSPRHQSSRGGRNAVRTRMKHKESVDFSG
jgi:hypothetical protein